MNLNHLDSLLRLLYFICQFLSKLTWVRPTNKAKIYFFDMSIIWIRIK